MGVTDETWTDLADRDSDGLEVMLLWNRASGRFTVTVADSKLGESFELDVAAADALAAFYHPFAYASDRRIGGRARNVHAELQPQR